MHDDDDPAADAEWFLERRGELEAYLAGQGLAHRPLGDTPAWYVAPYVSIWRLEPAEQAGATGWWAISGDLPNDYVPGSKARNPREAMNCIASLWKEAAEYMARGERHPTFVIGSGADDSELAPMLASRAEMLLEWAADPAIWDNDES